MWTMTLLAFDYLTVTVSMSVRIVLMVNQANILLWQTLVWCCFADRRWQQCRNQNRLELLLMTSDITRYRMCTVLVDIVLILHVSRTTKITVTLFTIISTYSPPWRQKNREARSTTFQLIRLITGRIVAGHDCIIQCNHPSINNTLPGSTTHLREVPCTNSTMLSST